jgi:excinuclease UvrABC ATPase subunit
VNGHVLDITAGMKLDRYKTHDIEIVVDRMVIENTPDNEKRLSEYQHRHASWRKCIDGAGPRF